MDSNTNAPTIERRLKERRNADTRQPAGVKPEDYIAISHYGGLITYHPVTNIANAQQSSYNLPTLSSALAIREQTYRISHCDDPISFRTLFVKNLEISHTTKDLFILFEPYGKIITYRTILDARSQRFGFVTFLHPDSALNALMDLNGRLLGSNRLIVEPALLQWPQNIWKNLITKKEAFKAKRQSSRQHIRNNRENLY